MTFSPITHLRHVDIAVPDYDRQIDFYTTLWGLTPVASDTGVTFLAAEGSPEQYIVRVRKAAEKRLDVIGFGARDPAAVDELARELAASGVTLVSEPDKLDTPGGGYGFRFFDIDGRTVEISSDVLARAHRAVEERESIPVRLAHVVINSTDIDRTRAFYEKHLSFRHSDTLTSARMGELMHFMRCSPVHHSLAISRGPHVALHHLSFELRGIDEFMRGTGRLLRAGVEKTWGPGRHKAGDNTFSYFKDPHGNIMEYTTLVECLDEDTYHPHLYSIEDPEVADQWGTAGPMNELVAQAAFNDPDRGLFIAPPL